MNPLTLPDLKASLKTFFGNNQKLLPDGTLILYNIHPLEYDHAREEILKLSGIKQVEFRQSLLKPRMY